MLIIIISNKLAVTVVVGYKRSQETKMIGQLCLLHLNLCREGLILLETKSLGTT